MNRTRSFSLLLAGLTASVLVAALCLHAGNRALRREIAAQTRPATREPAPSVREAGSPLAGNEASAPDPEFAALASEAARLRGEVRVLEEKASREYAAHSYDPSETSRDPEVAMTRLEHLRDVGQATPSATVQTLFWAAFHGEDQTLRRMIALDERGRSRAADFISGLGASQRAHCPTPESLMALVLSDGLLKVSAIQILETTSEPGETAHVRIRGVTGKDETVALRRGAAGWQVLYTDKQVEWAISEVSAVRP